MQKALLKLGATRTFDAAKGRKEDSYIGNDIGVNSVKGPKVEME